MRLPGTRFFLRNVNDEHMRYISRAEGEHMFATGQASKVLKEIEHGRPNQKADDRLIGFRLRITVRPPEPGSPTLRKSEAMASAGVYGPSHTANLIERDKQLHTRRTRFPGGIVTETPETEDFIELAQAKVAFWPTIGDERAVRVGPRVDEAALRQFVSI